MSELLPQPFLNGLKEFPEKRRKEIAEIRKWYNKQLHYPTISDEYLLLFFHGCVYNVDKTKRTLDHYFNIRTNNPALFADRDLNLPSVKNVLDFAYMTPLPEKCPKGYNVLLYALSDTDPRRFVFAEAVKVFGMFNDVRLSEDGLSDGYVVLFDMKGSSVGHFARVTLPALRAFMQYIQQAHPARLKSVHVLNTAAFINHVMKLIQPLIQADIFNILKFHNGLPSEEDIPLKMLPVEYGGMAPSIIDLHRDHTKLMKFQYTDWLIQSGNLVCDETKKSKKKSFGSFFSGPEID